MKKPRPLHFYFIIIISLISIFFIIERISFYFVNINDYPADSLIVIQVVGRDADFRLIKYYMDMGIIKMYEAGMPYLYYSYFIFYPIYFLPTYIGVYVSDVLRLFAVIYVVKNLYKITEDKQDQLFFYILCIIGYGVDMSLNNNNGLILFFLFGSMVQLKKENKIFSGILFSLAAFKILVIFFPFILILSKKIKFKELIYYFLPLALLCLPYFIIPQYTLLMLQNWTGRESTNLIIEILVFIWQISQTAQLLFMSFMGLTLIIDLEQFKKIGQYKKQIRVIVFITLFFIYVIFETLNVAIGYHFIFPD